MKDRSTKVKVKTRPMPSARPEVKRHCEGASPLAPVIARSDATKQSPVPCRATPPKYGEIACILGTPVRHLVYSVRDGIRERVAVDCLRPSPRSEEWRPRPVFRARTVSRGAWRVLACTSTSRDTGIEAPAFPRRRGAPCASSGSTSPLRPTSSPWWTSPVRWWSSPRRSGKTPLATRPSGRCSARRRTCSSPWRPPATTGRTSSPCSWRRGSPWPCSTRCGRAASRGRTWPGPRRMPSTRSGSPASRPRSGPLSPACRRRQPRSCGSWSACATGSARSSATGPGSSTGWWTSGSRSSPA